MSVSPRYPYSGNGSRSSFTSDRPQTDPYYVGKGIAAACVVASQIWPMPGYQRHDRPGPLSELKEGGYERELMVHFHFNDRAARIFYVGRDSTNARGEPKIEWQIEEIRLEELSTTSLVRASVEVAVFRMRVDRALNGMPKERELILEEFNPQEVLPLGGYVQSPTRSPRSKRSPARAQ